MTGISFSHALVEGKETISLFYRFQSLEELEEKKNFETYCLDYFVLLVTLNRDTIGSKQIRTIVPHRSEK